MVKLELNLPWKPVLGEFDGCTRVYILHMQLTMQTVTLDAAWPWGVSYLVDPDTFLVTKHIESWDIEAWEVRYLQNVEPYAILLRGKQKLTLLLLYPGCETNLSQAHCQNWLGVVTFNLMDAKLIALHSV